MNEAAAFAGVDWGTSSFRLWLMAGDGRVLAERRSEEGMAAVRPDFAAALEAHLAAVAAPAGLPVVICGMAGARQGWVEAPYLDVPARLADIAGRAVAAGAAPRDIRILPGLAQRRSGRADVMRGEETQLLGAAGEPAGASGLCCMPGTHSKWVRLDGGRVDAFTTFMTGELFAVLSQHSILAHTLAGTAGDPDEAHFATAVREGYENAGALTAKLFSIRGGQLLFDDTPARARARLSGLLVGVELAGSGWHESAGEPVRLIASGRLKTLYEAAFAALAIPFETVDAEAAVRAGLHRAAQDLWTPL